MTMTAKTTIKTTNSTSLNLPKVYAGGLVFAFSGLDGETSYEKPFVGNFLCDQLGLRFQFGIDRELVFRLKKGVREIDYQLITGDIMEADLYYNEKPSPLLMIFADTHTIVGHCGNCEPVLNGGINSIQEKHSDITISSSKSDVLILTTSEEKGIIRFALCYGDIADKDKLLLKAQASLDINLCELKEKRLDFLRKLPKCNFTNKHIEELFYKCCSIQKLNTYSPTGKIPVRWTTPDRVPHKDMWLWDSVFHSIGLRHIDISLAKDAIYAVLSSQHKDGMIAHAISPYKTSTITQPPVLAWGAFEVYKFCKDKNFLKKCYEPLKLYLEWDMKNRDKNNNYLLEWFIEDDPKCRSGESGMDNSVRFDEATDMDAIDFSCFLSNEAKHMALICKEIGKDEDLPFWNNISNDTDTAINSILWCEEDKFYYDRDMKGEFNYVKACSSFLPLFSKTASIEQGKQLVKHLTNTDEFWCELPIPSISLDNPKHSTDMWRGSTWINYTLMICIGLVNYGYDDLAMELKNKTLNSVLKWYLNTGTVFEFYDCHDRIEPTRLIRKGICTPPVNHNRKIFAVRDFGWTSAIIIDILMNNNLKDIKGAKT